MMYRLFLLGLMSTLVLGGVSATPVSMVPTGVPSGVVTGVSTGVFTDLSSDLSTDVFTDVVSFPQSTPGLDSEAWNLEMVNASGAWNYTLGSREVIVAVIDSGIVWNDQVPTSLRWENTAEVNGVDGVDDDGNGYVDDKYGWDFYEGDNDPSSDSSGSNHEHATFISGIIAGLHDHRKVEGIAPNVTLMNLRVLDPSNLFYDMGTIYDAFRYAMEMNASVVNFSIYFNGNTPEELSDLFAEMTSRGITIVGVTGNDYANRVVSPGDDPSVIAVTAIDSRGERAVFANTGADTELAAPGVDVVSVGPGGVVEVGSGTSYAAPHVTAAVALMKSLGVNRSDWKLRQVLRHTAEDLGRSGRDATFGFGLLDVGTAVQAWLEYGRWDFDGDGLNTSYEESLGLRPFEWDTDGGGLDDGAELALGLDPWNATDDAADWDGDGLSNAEEYYAGTDMESADSDGDGMPDPYELDNGLNATYDDSGGDPDADGLTNLREYELGTDPWDADSDGDGMPDGWEVENGLDPLEDDSAGDPDGDGVSNIEEYLAGSDPLVDESSTTSSTPGSSVRTPLFFLPVLLAPAVLWRRRLSSSRSG